MRALMNLVQEVSYSEEDFIIDEGVEGIVERAPPGKKAKRFIKRHREEFKKRYGDAWKQVLYATAWKNFG